MNRDAFLCRVLAGAIVVVLLATGSSARPQTSVKADGQTYPRAAEPVARQPVARQPVGRRPVTRQPVAREPVTRQPIARQPVTPARPVPRPQPALPAQPAQPAASPAPLLVRRALDDKHVVQRADLTRGQIRQLFRTELDSITDIRVAPRERAVALIETKHGAVGSSGDAEGEYTTPPRNQLVLVDPAGSVLQRLGDDVREYAFDPAGTRLAYIVGTFYEGEPGFVPNGAFLLDLQTGRSERIAGAERAFELQWVTTNSEDAIYFKVPGAADASTTILRFDVRTRRIAPAGVRGLHFSADGRFYLVEPAESVEEGLCEPNQAQDSCLRVYDRQSNRAIAWFQQTTLGTPQGWVEGGGHALLFSNENRPPAIVERQRGALRFRLPLRAQVANASNTIYDAETRQPLDRFEGVVSPKTGITGWASTRSHLVVVDPKRRSALPNVRDSLHGVMLRKVAAVAQPPALATPAAAMSGDRALRSASATSLLHSVRVTTEPDTIVHGTDLRSLVVDDIGACSAACQQDGSCEAYTFVRPAAGASHGRCVLKSSASGSQPDRCCVSGSKVRPAR